MFDNESYNTPIFINVIKLYSQNHDDVKMRVHNALQIGGKGLKGHSVSGDNGSKSSSVVDNGV